MCVCVCVCVCVCLFECKHAWWCNGPFWCFIAFATTNFENHLNHISLYTIWTHMNPLPVKPVMQLQIKFCCSLFLSSLRGNAHDQSFTYPHSPLHPSLSSTPSQMLQTKRTSAIIFCTESNSTPNSNAQSPSPPARRDSHWFTDINCPQTSLFLTLKKEELQLTPHTQRKGRI